MVLLASVWYSGAKGGILDGWGVCDGGSLITALIAWASVVFRLWSGDGVAGLLRVRSEV